MKNIIVLLTFIAIPKSIQALTCSSNIDCNNSPNTICLNRECICKKNYFLYDNKCIALLNTNCVRHTECRVKYSICSPKAKKCRCAYGYYSSNDKKICKKYARYLNDTCIETYGCRNLKFSECSKDKKCVCKEHHVEKSGQCKSSVGGSCKNDFDCGVDNSVCRSGKCQCSNEFIFSNELRTCIELVVPNNTESSSTKSVNGMSEETHSKNNGNNSNVQSNTTCSGNSCNDSENITSSSFTATTTELDTELKLPCKNNEECKVFEPPNCTPETCIYQIGFPCITDRVCGIENSHCHSSSCQCKDDYIYAPFLKRCVKVY